jgi:hypothetical protein
LKDFLEDLKINFDLLEKSVSSRSGSYFGLEQQALLTDISDYLNIFSHFNDVTSFVEFGSAYGHGPLIFSRLFPFAQAIGIEFEEVRFNTAVALKNNFKLNNCEFILDDLAIAKIPCADLYFLYFPTGPILDRILFELSQMSHKSHLIVVESHSDLIPRLEKETWLTEAFEIPLVSPRHYSKAKVYASGGLKLSSYFDFSFKEKYFMIRDSDHSIWIGDSLGLEWHSKDSLTLLNPPYTIHENQIQALVEFSSFNLPIQHLIKLRALGEVKIESHLKHFQGFIRKIYIELSTGERINFDDLSKIDPI